MCCLCLRWGTLVPLLNCLLLGLNQRGALLAIAW